MKTIAKQLNIKNFPFEIKDANGNLIYFETSNGVWSKYQYDANNNQIHYKNCSGGWSKQEYDANGNQSYYEDSEGSISDNRNIKLVLTMDEIAEKFGVDVKNLKIKK